MATYYVNGSTGDDNTTDATSASTPYETIQGAFDDLAEADPEGGAAFSAGDIISIADGTYTENVNPNKPWIVKSTSANAANVVITSSGNGKTVDLGSAANGITFQDITINYTHSKSSSRGAIICASSPVVILTTCIIGSTSYGIKSSGDNSIFTRCKFVHIAGQTSTYNYGISTSNNFTAQSCLFINWLKYAIHANAGGAGQVIRNCTVIVESGKTVAAGVYINGDGSGGPSLANTIVYNAGVCGIGIWVPSTSDVCTIKNNLVYNDGGTMTVTSEYFRLNSSTTANNWSTDHSSETEADHTVDSGEDLFVDYDNGDYSPNADGSAAGNGLASLAASTDYAGNSFSSPPSIGCYEVAASGWSGGSAVGPTSVGSCASVVGLAVGSIASIKGV